MVKQKFCRVAVHKFTHGSLKHISTRIAKQLKQVPCLQRQASVIHVNATLGIHGSQLDAGPVSGTHEGLAMQ